MSNDDYAELVAFLGEKFEEARQERAEIRRHATVLSEEVRTELRVVAEGVDARFETMDARFDGVDARFETMDARFDGVDARFETMDTRFDRMDGRFDRMDERLDRMAVRLGKVEQGTPE